MTDYSAEIIFLHGQFWHGQGRPLFDVIHLTFPLPTTASLTRRCQDVLRMVLERLSWRVTYSNSSSFHLLTVARRGPCEPLEKLILLRT